MTFGNPIIAGGGDLVRRQMKSPNFVTLISGWIIRQDGSAEFNNVIVRGSLQAGTIDIPATGVDGFHVQADGTTIWGTPGAGQPLYVDPAGILHIIDTSAIYFGADGTTGQIHRAVGRMHIVDPLDLDLDAPLIRFNGVDVAQLATAWTPYVPVLGQGGAVAKTTTYAKYKQVGKTCICDVRLDVTGAGVIGNGITISAPVNIAAGATGLVHGNGLVYDASVPANGKHVMVRSISATTFDFPFDGTSLAIGGAFALAAGDVIQVCFTYETV